MLSIISLIMGGGGYALVGWPVTFAMAFGFIFVGRALGGRTDQEVVAGGRPGGDLIRVIVAGVLLAASFVGLVWLGLLYVN
jgi:hypothetical protein